MLDVALRHALVELLEVHRRYATLGVFRLRRALRLTTLVCVIGVFVPALAHGASLISGLTLARRCELLLAA